MSTRNKNKKNAGTGFAGGWLEMLPPTQEKGKHSRGGGHKEDSTDARLEGGLTALANLEMSMTCFYCHNLFHDPVSTPPCNHCFCTDCVNAAQSEAISARIDLMCPICENTVLEGSLDTLERNRGVHEIVELYRTVKPFLQQIVTTAIESTCSPQKTKKKQVNSEEMEGNENPPVPKKTHEVEELSWDQYFDQLVEFQNESGHTNVTHPVDGDPVSKNFYKWVCNQRYTLPKLLENEDDPMASEYAERVEKLNSIGFYWGPFPPDHVAPRKRGARTAFQRPSAISKGKEKDMQKWEAMFEKFVEHVNEFGPHKMPEQSDEESRKLYFWIRNQRTILGKKRFDVRSLTPLHAERIEKLDAVNFRWSKKEAEAAGEIAPKPSTPQRRNHSENTTTPTKSNNKKRPPDAVDNNAANLAETLGKVLGAFDTLGVLNNNFGALQNVGAISRNDKRTVDSRKPKPIAASFAAGATDTKDISSAAEKKRLRMESKLDRLKQQLSDAEQNVTRFQGVNEVTMAEQAKVRMVDLYNKVVELEQHIIVAVDEAFDDQEEEYFVDKSKRRKFSKSNSSSRKKNLADLRRARLDCKLDLVSKQLAETENNISRFQAICDETMVEQAKSRMTKLYNDKVEIENELIDIFDDDDDDDDGK